MTISFQSKVKKEDVERLIADQTDENRQLDYKAEQPGSSDAAKAEFRYDVTAMANTVGGAILLGVEEERPSRKPKAATGLAIASFDEERRRLLSILASNIEPKLANITIDEVGGFPRGPVIALRVSRSWNGPHAVRYNDSFRVYVRTEGGNRILEWPEVRRSITQAHSLNLRVSALRGDRVSQLLAGEGPVNVEARPLLLVHVVSWQSIAEEPVLDLRFDDKVLRELRPFTTLAGIAAESEPTWNADGRLSSCATLGPQWRDYVQMFRNGVVEIGHVAFATPYGEHQTQGDWKGKVGIAAIEYEQDLVAALPRYIELIRRLGLQGPTSVFLTILRASGLVMRLPNERANWLPVEKVPIDRHVLSLPPVYLEEDEPPGLGLADKLRPAFDAVWQACGIEGSPNYSDGKWAPCPRNFKG